MSKYTHPKWTTSLLPSSFAGGYPIYGLEKLPRSFFPAEAPNTFIGLIPLRIEMLGSQDLSLYLTQD
jgi:hypothetical protein